MDQSTNIEFNPPPQLEILLKLITGAAEILGVSKFGHMHIYYFRPFQAISSRLSVQRVKLFCPILWSVATVYTLLSKVATLFASSLLMTSLRYVWLRFPNRASLQRPAKSDSTGGIGTDH